MIRFGKFDLGRLVVLLVGIVVVTGLVWPNELVAKVEYVNGSGSAEGDPGDGFGFSGGTGGDDNLGSDMVGTSELGKIQYFQFNTSVLLGSFVPGTKLPVFVWFVPRGIEFSSNLPTVEGIK